MICEAVILRVRMLLVIVRVDKKEEEEETGVTGKSALKEMV